MTDETENTTTETPATPEQTHPVDPGIEALAQGSDDIAKVRKEAANYRRKLRDAEAERDKLAARLSDADRAEVERQITGDGGLQNPADLWLAGVQLDDLRDDDGGLDADKVKAAKERVISEHPHWREVPPDFDGGARETTPDTSGPSFGKAIKNAMRG